MQENIDIFIVLIASCSIALFILAIFFLIVVNKYDYDMKGKQKEALTNLITGQDNERARLARDLHDEMGAALSAIIFKLDEIKDGSAETSSIKEETILQLQEAKIKIRQISHDLLPRTLSRYNLAGALTEMAISYKRPGLTMSFDTNCRKAKFGEQTELHLYRIVTELLNNTEKHSNASVISITLMYDKPVLTLGYADDGHGIISGGEPAGIGLKNIRTRSALINGHLDINGQNGFNLKLSLKTNENIGS